MVLGRLSLRACRGALVATVAVWTVVGAQEQPPQFRVEATAVAVPVLVKSGGRPVSDLTIADFALTDNGVRQTVTALQGIGAPLDVSLIVQQTRIDGSGNTDSLNRELREIEAVLLPGDMFEAVTTSAQGRLGRTTDMKTEPIQPTRNHDNHSCESTYDALVRVLVRPPMAGRHRVIFVLTESAGGGGVMTPEIALDVAQRSNAQVHAMALGRRWTRGQFFRQRVQWQFCANSGMEWTEATRRGLTAIAGVDDVHEQDRRLLAQEHARLAELAEATGGRQLRPAIFSQSIAGPVRTALAEARQRYLLYYTPSGVPATGWHDVQVSINRPGRFDISARPGYRR